MKERTTAKFYTITMAILLWISAFVLVLNTRTINAAGEPIQSTGTAIIKVKITLYSKKTKTVEIRVKVKP